MAAYTPASTKTITDYNFVAAFNVHKPDYDNKLTTPFGSGLLTGLLDMVGNSKGTSALKYSHFKSERLMPKIKATNGGAGAAGAAVSFTLAAAAITAASTNSPYQGAIGTQKNPVRLNDLIMIKPGTGTVSASTVIRAMVTAVNDSAGTFTAAPLDSADSIPSIASADEIVIYGNAFAEGTAQPLSRTSEITESTNQLQIVKDTFEITGSENDVILWFEVVDPITGKKGYTYGVKGESDTHIMFLNYRELVMYVGEQYNNNTVITSNSLAMTNGLVPFALGGTVSNYNAIAGWTLQDAENLVKELDKQKGSKGNILSCGINLSLQIDRELGDRFQNGAISYGNFNFSDEKMVNLQFSKFKIGEYTFLKQTNDAMNDLQTLGADGFGFPNEGLIIPMDNKMDAKSREVIPSLRKRYLVNPDTNESREFKVAMVDLFKTGDDGLDRSQTRYISHCGFEGFARNRFGYIKQA